MLFWLVFRTSRGSGGRGREGDDEPAISHKQAVALFGSDYAYWYFKPGSLHLDALLLSRGKTLLAVQRHPESHGFLSRAIQRDHYYMWVKDADKLSDARLLTPADLRDLALAVEERLASFPGH
jgi:hypothetical protein